MYNYPISERVTGLVKIRQLIRGALVQKGVADAATHDFIDFPADILAINTNSTNNTNNNTNNNSNS